MGVCSSMLDKKAFKRELRQIVVWLPRVRLTGPDEHIIGRLWSAGVCCESDIVVTGRFSWRVGLLGAVEPCRWVCLLSAVCNIGGIWDVFVF